MAEDNYLSDIPNPTKTGFENPVVKEALRIASDWSIEHQAEMWQRDFLNREMDNSIRDTAIQVGNKSRNTASNSVHKLTTQVLYAVRRSVGDQMALHDIRFKGGNVSDEFRLMMQGAYEAILRKAGYKTVMQNVDGLVGTGDQFWSWYWNRDYVNDKKGFPIKIKASGISSLFFPQYATALRNFDDDRIADKFVRKLFRGQWDQAKRLYPWIEEKGGTSGEIPLNTDMWTLDKQIRPYRTTSGKDDARITEVFEFVDPVKKIAVEFAGRTAVPNDPQEGKDFPYTGENNDEILPIYQRKLIRPNTGLFGVGVFQAAYRLAVIDRMLKNIGITYEMTNLNQIKIVSIDPESGETEDSLTQKKREALQSQLRGQEPVIFSRGVQGVSSLHTPPIIQEMFGMIDMIEKNLAQLGIPISLLLTDPQKTLGATEIEIENQSVAIRGIQKRNAPELESFHNDFLAWMVKNLSEDDNTPLQMSVPIMDSKDKPREVSGVMVENENGEKELAQFTVGNFVKTQKREGFHVEVDPNSGVATPRIFQRQLTARKYNTMLQLGNREGAAQAAQEMFAIDGIKFNTKLPPPPQPNQPQNDIQTQSLEELSQIA